MKKLDEIQNYGQKEILSTDSFHVGFLKAVYNDMVDTSSINGPISCFMKGNTSKLSNKIRLPNKQFSNAIGN